MKQLMKERDFVKQIELLNDIKSIWNNFANIVLVLERYFSLMQEFGFSDSFNIDATQKRIIREKNDLREFIALKKAYNFDDYNRIIEDFRQILDKYNFEEMLANSVMMKNVKKYIKDFKQEESTLLRFIQWYKENIKDLYLFLDLIKKPDLDINEVISIKRKFYIGWEKIRKSFINFEHINNFIFEVNALIKITTGNFVNYEKAKEVCNKKKINLNSEGLVFHGTNDNIWTPSKIVRFVEKGLQPSVNLDRFTISSLYPKMVCFTLSCRGGITPLQNPFNIIFVLNPVYVSDNRKEFFYNPLPYIKHSFLVSKEQMKNSLNFEETCKKMGFISKQTEGYFDLRKTSTGYFNEEWKDEVQTINPVPFSAIIATVVDDSLIYRMSFFMSKLSHKNPELTFPVYNKKGTIVWPL